MTNTAVIGALVRERDKKNLDLQALKSVITRTERELEIMKTSAAQTVEDITHLEGTLDAIAPGWEDE